MNPGCASVLKGKRLALLERLAVQVDWPDKHIHQIKVGGVLQMSLLARTKKFLDNMNPGCATVLKGKHLALLERPAVQIDWPDKHIDQDFRDGLKLTGLQHPSGICAADIKPRSLTEEDLVKRLKFLQPAL